MNSKEQWLPFRDGTYEVSDSGGIRRAKPGTSTYVGRPLLPIQAATGYAQVHVSSDGESFRAYVHRLVAECFIGPCPAGCVVNHRDGDKQNNALVNLEYVTYAANVVHALATVGRRRGPSMPVPAKKGPQCGDEHWSRRHPERLARGETACSKIGADDVNEIRYLAAIGRPQKTCAIMYGISVAQVSRIVLRHRWAHLPPPTPYETRTPDWFSGGGVA